MCRSKNDPCGGRRCPSSSALTAKREALRILEEYKNIQTSPSNVTLSSQIPSSLTELHTEINSLKDFIRTGPSSEVSLSEFDSQVESRLQHVGDMFVSEVDKIAEFSEDRMYDLLDERLGEVFSAPENLEALKHELITVTSGSVEEAELLSKIRDCEAMIENEEEATSNIERATYNEVNESYRKAYIEVLSQVREIGSEGKNFVIDDAYDDTDLKSMMDSTVFSHYPTDWLERHNEASAMYVDNAGEGTVHYNPDSKDDRGEHVSEVKNFKNIKTDSEGREFLMSNIMKHYEVVADGTQQSNEDSKNLIVYNLPEEELLDISIGEQEAPSGEGWEYRESMNYVLASGFSDNESFKEATAQKMWVRRKTQEQKTVNRLSFYSPETLKTNTEEHNKAVLYHEFAHRMEQVLPDNILPRLERAFLLRRSGKNESDQHSNLLQNIISDEHYHSADFVSHYVGREYFTGKSYEVFATGVEALFGKNFGGLIALDADNPQRDEDHRRFTLGVLAVL